MAYVVARRGGRFEIRESVHTVKGPRARTLAGFRVLTDEVLRVAAGRAQRQFDSELVVRSGLRAGARVEADISGSGPARDRFLSGSRRMVETFAQSAFSDGRMDPGVALFDLLGFADTIRASQSLRPREPLAFPPLARIAERRRSTRAAAGAR